VALVEIGGMEIGFSEEEHARGSRREIQILISQDSRRGFIHKFSPYTQAMNLITTRLSN